MLPPFRAALVRALLVLPFAAGLAHTAQAADDADDVEDGGRSEPAEELSPVEVIGSSEFARGAVGGYRARRSATATRTDAAIDKLPVSVQVVSAELIEDSGARDIATALRNVSGVAQVETTTLIAAREAAIIRGFQQRDVFFDGFRLGSAPTLDVAGLERVEVLKGPASILFGLSEPGGIVNIVPRQPIATPGGLVAGEIGRFDQDEVRFDLHGGLQGPRIAGRLIGLRRADDAFRDTVFLERELFQPTLAMEIGENWRLSAQHSRQREQRSFDEGLAFGVGGRPVSARSTYLGEPRLDGSDFDSDLTTLRLERGLGPLGAVRFGGLRQRFGHDYEAFRPLGEPGEEPLPIPLLDQLAGLGAIPGLGDALIGVTDPVADDEVARFYDLAAITAETYQLQLDAVLRFSLGGLEHELVVGVDRRHEELKQDAFRGLDLIVGGELFPQKINIVEPQFGDPIPTQFVADGFVDARQDFTGFFLQSRSFSLDERLNLLYGLRYDSVDARDVSLRAFDRIQAQLNPLAPAPEPTRTERSDQALTYRAAALYEWSDTVSPYFGVSTSFIPVAPTQRAEAGGELEPERGRQFELGNKMEWLDGQMSTTVALYRIVKRDVSVQNPDGPPGSFVNGGKLRSQGVEVDIAGKPLRGMDIIANYSFTDTEALESDVIPDGATFRNVPRHAGGLTISYRRPEGALRGLGATLSAFAVSDRAGNTQDSFRIPGYTVVDAFASWRLPFAGLLLTPRFGVANVFDREYFLAANALSSVVPGAPRTWTASLEAAF